MQGFIEKSTSDMFVPINFDPEIFILVILTPERSELLKLVYWKIPFLRFAPFIDILLRSSAVKLFSAATKIVIALAEAVTYSGALLLLVAKIIFLKFSVN